MPTSVVVTDDDDVVPVHRQMALADGLRAVSRWRIAGGHAVCTTAPERFVPALLDACTSVARRPALTCAA